MKKFFFFLDKHWIGFALAIVALFLLSAKDFQLYPWWIHLFEVIIIVMITLVSIRQYIDWKDVHRHSYKKM